MKINISAKIFQNIFHRVHIRRKDWTDPKVISFREDDAVEEGGVRNKTSSYWKFQFSFPTRLPARSR